MSINPVQEGEAARRLEAGCDLSHVSALSRCPDPERAAGGQPKGVPWLQEVQSAQQALLRGSVRAAFSCPPQGTINA